MFSNRIDRRRFLSSVVAGGAALSLPSLARAKSNFNPAPREVRIKPGNEPGQVLIVPQAHYLYLITEERKAIRYGVGIGKAGLAFSGTAVIEVKKEWPTWRPTDEMIEREPENYTKFINTSYVQPGGRKNPLGARAMYLFRDGVDTFFRIHGTKYRHTVGQSTSSGCIRMLNEHVIDLYQRVPIGTVVTVL